MTNQEINVLPSNHLSAQIRVDDEIVEVEPNPSDLKSTNTSLNVAGEHVSTKKIARVALIGATVAALAFEQGPANESVRVAIALNVLEDTGSSVLAGGAVAAATMAIESTTSTIVALGLNREKETVKRITSKFKKKSAPELDTNTNDVVTEKTRTVGAKTADLAIALGFGPAITVTKRHFEDVEPTLQSDIKRGLNYSAIGASVSGVVGYLVTGGIQHAEAIGLEKPAEYVIEYGTDMRFWTGVLAVIYGSKGIKKLVNKSTETLKDKQG